MKTSVVKVNGQNETYSKLHDSGLLLQFCMSYKTTDLIIHSLIRVIK